MTDPVAQLSPERQRRLKAIERAAAFWEEAATRGEATRWRVLVVAKAHWASALRTVGDVILKDKSRDGTPQAWVLMPGGDRVLLRKGKAK